jgi:hypothetical protein
MRSRAESAGSSGPGQKPTETKTETTHAKPPPGLVRSGRRFLVLTRGRRMRDSNPRGREPNPLSKSALARFTVSPDVHLSLRGVFPNVSGRLRTVTTETRTETSTVKSHDVDHHRGNAELDNVPKGEVTLTLVAKLPSLGSPGAARIDFDGDERRVVRSRQHQHCSSPSVRPSPEGRKLGRRRRIGVSGSGGRKPWCCGAAFHSPRHDFADIGSTTQSPRVAACLRTRRAAPGEVGNEFRHHGA